MMRSTRHGSVLVKDARRSMGTTCGGMSSCSSSVSGLRGEELGCSDIVILQVVEERRESNVTGPTVRDDATRGQVTDSSRRVRTTGSSAYRECTSVARQ